MTKYENQTNQLTMNIQPTKQTSRDNLKSLADFIYNTIGEKK